MKRITNILMGVCLLMMSCSLSAAPTETAAPPTRAATTAFTLTSSGFKQGEAIPKKFGCKDQGGENRSPQLAWGTPPSTKTASFTLIVDDLDAPGGTYTHWVIYNMLAPTRRLDENMTKEKFTTLGNGKMLVEYFGPCPPSGSHRYFFKLYALDINLPDPTGANEEAKIAQLKKSMEGHILNMIELRGTYSR